MEGYCSTGQSPQRAVVPMEKEEDIFYLSNKSLLLKITVQSNAQNPTLFFSTL
jgi:hypothetical protein